MSKCRLALRVLASAALGIACNKEAPPTAEQPRSPTAASAPDGPAEPAAAAGEAAPPAAAQSAAARISEAPFDLHLEGSPSYEAGKDAVVSIVLEAKPPFKVNEEYPYKFKVKEAPSLKYKSAVVGKDAAKHDKQRLTMPVSFVPESAGEHSVAGQFAFSVCTDENCLIEKRDLELVVSVK